MARIINKFEAEDGTQFDTAAQADAHDAGLKNKAVIEAFIVSAKLEKAHAGFIRKQLAAFIAFEATYEAPAPVTAETAETKAEGGDQTGEPQS